MTDREDIEILAGEYVLGTLDSDERVAVSARRQREPLLDRAIHDWERRIAPLLQEADEIEPPPELFAQIAARLDSPMPSDALKSFRTSDATALASLRRQVATWRSAAAGASLIAASLLGFIVVGEMQLSDDQQKYVAVFQEGDIPPTFLLSIDLETREMTIRPVTAVRPDGKDYQLWIVAEQLGPAPRSLGLLEVGTAPIRKRLEGYDAELLQGATFGISLEPEGGSPTGKPTGPALHGKLIPTAL